MALREAYLTMRRRADSYFVRYGVTADQFVILAALAEQSALTQRELVERVSSDPNTVRAMLTLLQGAGLVVRAKHPTDGRARSVALTKKGRRIYQKLWDGSEPFRTQLLGAFESEEVESLLRLLRRVTVAMELGARHPPAQDQNRNAAHAPVDRPA
jgi:DNA-binding MarR family transcriptional regulator